MDFASAASALPRAFQGHALAHDGGEVVERLAKPAAGLALQRQRGREEAELGDFVAVTMAESASVIGTPMAMSPATRPNSVADGSVISRATMRIASVSGTPARTDRTIMASAVRELLVERAPAALDHHVEHCPAAEDRRSAAWSPHIMDPPMVTIRPDSMRATSSTTLRTMYHFTGYWSGRAALNRIPGSATRAASWWWHRRSARCCARVDALDAKDAARSRIRSARGSVHARAWASTSMNVNP